MHSKAYTNGDNDILQYIGASGQWNFYLLDGDDYFVWTTTTQYSFWCVTDGGAGDDTIYGGGFNENPLYTGELRDDTIIGGTGADYMNGGDRGDVYYVDNDGDEIDEITGGGHDHIYTSIDFYLPDNVEVLHADGNRDLQLTGNARTNTIYGGGGNNIIDGLAGSDTMDGGGGNDTYYVNSGTDVVAEDANQGTDQVRSTTSYALPANVEKLILLYSDDLAATGNNGDNTLSGNGGDNVLDGRSGSDMLIGGDGNDTYVVDSGADSVRETDTYTRQGAAKAAEGNDLVKASATFTLPQDVERLRLTGQRDINGTGNATANLIEGNDGNNILTGGGGADILTGGDGKDAFRFASTTGGRDVVKDFNRRQGDKLFFTRQAFGRLAPGLLGRDRLQFSNSGVATGDGPVFVFSRQRNTLYYDADGAGKAKAVAVVTTQTVSLTAQDIRIVG